MGKHKPRKTKATDMSRYVSQNERLQNYPKNRKGHAHSDIPKEVPKETTP